MSKSTDEAEIRRIAYRLWINEGQPEGRDRHHWETAKEIWAFQTRNMPDSPARKSGGRHQDTPKLAGSHA